MLLLLHINQAMADHEALCRVVNANTPEPGTGWFRDPFRQTYYYSYWTGVEMSWVVPLLSKIGSSRSLNAFSVHDDERSILAERREQMDISFMRQEGLWIAHCDANRKVVGTGVTQEAAEKDFYCRLATGWYEGRQDRVIAAIKAGLAARLSTTAAGSPGYELLQNDIIDCQALIDAMTKGNFILYTAEDVSG